MEQAATFQALPTGQTLVCTNAAAAFIDMKPQTLRKWACHDTGPLRPVRIGGRLRWRVSDLQKLIEG